MNMTKRINLKQWFRIISFLVSKNKKGRNQKIPTFFALRNRSASIKGKSSHKTGFFHSNVNEAADPCICSSVDYLLMCQLLVRPV